MRSVLFLCTGNSARSLMAEALLRALAGDRYEVHSAGLEPSRVHPLTVQVLQELGIDTSSLRSKGVETFLGRTRPHHAIIVCERAAASCPRIYPFAAETLTWPFDDPAAFAGTGEERLAKFRAVRDQIAARLEDWLSQQDRGSDSVAGARAPRLG